MSSVVYRKGPILRELALAATAGFVFAVSPFTPNEWAPSAAGGALVGASVLAWRLRSRSPVWREMAEDGGAALPGREQWAGAALTLLCLAVFAPTLHWMYLEWTRSIWSNEHGLFVPFVMVWLARNRLRGDHGPPESSAWGLPLLAAGLALAALDANAGSHYLAALGLLLVLPGLSLLLLGPRRTRALRVPLLLGLLLVPIPYTVGTPLALRTITAMGVPPLLDLLGLTAIREGTQLIMPHQSFLVADACSGVATMYASLASALVLAAISESSWRRIAVLLLAPVLAIGANVVRVTLLVLIAHVFGADVLDTMAHEASGVATFGVVLVCLFFIAQFRSGASAET